MENDMDSNDDYGFFITFMGGDGSRLADYYLGYFGGSVFIDFDNCEDQLIRIIRISFDGYGCCDLGNKAIPMNKDDSQSFREIIESGLSNPSLLYSIIKKTIFINKELIWEDVLMEYELL